MKQFYNLLAEIIALPFSSQFMPPRKDPIAECFSWDKEKEEPTFKGLSGVAQKIARGVNERTHVTNLGELQSMVNYVYSEGWIFDLLSRLSKTVKKTSLYIAQRCYLELLKQVTKTFLTTRNGFVAFKYWPSAHEAFAHNTVSLTKYYTENKEKPRDLLGIALSNNKIEAWNSLRRCFPDDILISCFALVLANEANHSGSAKRAMLEEYGLRCLEQFSDTVELADSLLMPILKHGMAETHLHANASRSFSMIWEYMILSAIRDKKTLRSNHSGIYSSDWDEVENTRQVKEALLLRTIIASYLCYCRDKNKSVIDYINDINPRYVRIFTKYERSLYEQTGLGSSLLEKLFEIYELRKFIANFSRQEPSPDMREPLRLILNVNEMFHIRDIGFAERFFLFKCLLHLDVERPDTTLQHMFFQYIRLKHAVYHRCSQNSKNTGLDYFVSFYKQSTDPGGLQKAKRMELLLKNVLRDKRVKKIEFRFAPHDIEMENINIDDAVRVYKKRIMEEVKLLIQAHVKAVCIMYSDVCPEISFDRDFRDLWGKAINKLREGRKDELRRLCKDKYEIDFDAVHEHRIGIIYHLIKDEDKGKLKTCFADEKNKWSNYSYGGARFKYEASIKAISEIRDISPELSGFLVGIDAASIELHSDPWVFAPAFRLVRELDAKPFSETGTIHDKKQGIGLTYHVGEEFRHIISGLRHIYEAADYFKLHAGDRLGHGIALGTDVEYWFKNRDMITIPRVEWMENCLWAWHIITLCSPTDINLANIEIFLEKQILEYANEIYGTLNGITVIKLFHSYLSKTEDNSRLIDKTKSFLCRGTGGTEKPEKHVHFCNDNYSGEFKDYFPCLPEDKDKYWSEDALTLSYHCNRIKRRMENEVIKVLTREEIHLSAFLQTYVRDYISRNGIIIETNPSSNAVIGENDGILNHHMLSFRDENNNKNNLILATINTDDPSVFSSSLANEHAYIFYSMLHNGASREDALDAVNKLRELGLSTSFLKEPLAFGEILDKYESILSQIL